MLTPDKIKEKTFQTTGRGSYRSEDVDSFFAEVATAYEQMFKENADLIRKISIFAKKIEEYRADEESLKMALLNAQKLADKIVAEAKETAANEVESIKGETDKLRADAAAEAAALEANAKYESESLLENAKRESNALLASAKEEAEKIVADANGQAKDILGNINRKVTHESLVYEMIQKEASEFKANLVSMYRDHINLINQLPEIVDEQLDKEEEEQASVAEVEEPVVEAPVVEDFVEAETVEVEEPVEAEDVVVIDEPEEIVVIDEEPVAEVTEEVVENEEPVVGTSAEQDEKKPFKIDLSRIDFADDDEEDVASAQPSMFDSFEVVEDDGVQDDDDDSRSISFKNFFKKK